MNWDPTTSSNTGIALSLKDESGASATFRLTLFNQNGAQVAQTSDQTLGAGNPVYVSRNVNEWFPTVPAPINGTVVVQLVIGNRPPAIDGY